MRNQIANMGSDVSPQEKMEASNQLSGALKTIFALAESYPDLKANDRFLKLTRRIDKTQRTKSLTLVNYTIQVLRDITSLFNQFQQTLLLVLVDSLKKKC